MRFLKRLVNFLIALLLLYLLYLAVVGEGVIDLRWVAPYVSGAVDWVRSLLGKG